MHPKDMNESDKMDFSSVKSDLAGSETIKIKVSNKPKSKASSVQHSFVVDPADAHLFEGQPRPGTKKKYDPDALSIAASDSASQKKKSINGKRDFSQILSDEATDTSSVARLKAKAKQMDRFASFDLTPCLLPIKGNPGLGDLEGDDSDEEGGDDNGGDDGISANNSTGYSNVSGVKEKQKKQIETCYELSQRHICRALRKKEVLQEIRNMVSRECNQAGVTCEKMILAHIHYNRARDNGPGKVKFHPGWDVQNVLTKGRDKNKEDDGNGAEDGIESVTEMAPTAPKDSQTKKCKETKQCFVKVWCEFSKTIQSESAFIPQKFEVLTSFDLNRQRPIVFGNKHIGEDDDEDGGGEADDEEMLSDVSSKENENENTGDTDPMENDGTADIADKNEIWPCLAFLSARDLSVNNFTVKKLQAVYKEYCSQEQKYIRAKKQDYKSVYFWDRHPANNKWKLFKESQDYFTELLKTNNKSEMVEMMFNSNPDKAINNGNLNQKVDNANMVKRALEERNSDKTQRDYVFPKHLAEKMEDPEFKVVRDRILLRKKIDQFIADIGKAKLGDEDDSVEHIRKQADKLHETLNRARKENGLPPVNEEGEEIEESQDGETNRRKKPDYDENKMEVEEPEPAVPGANAGEDGAALNADLLTQLKSDLNVLRIDLRDFKKSRLKVFDELLTQKELRSLIKELSTGKSDIADDGHKILEALNAFTPYDLVEETLPELSSELAFDNFTGLDTESCKVLQHSTFQLDQADFASLLIERMLTFLEMTRPPVPDNQLAQQREYETKVLMALRSWYDRDCTPVTMKRRRGIVIFSTRRGLGKTYLSTSFVNYDPNRYIMCSTRFTREQFLKNFMSQIWLLIIDDLAVDLRKPTDVEMLKKLLTGQPCTIIDKYMNLDYPGGVPVILTTNDREMFLEMANSPNFQEDCVFVELQDYIGPPEFRQTSRVATEIAVSFKTQEDLANYNPLRGGGRRGKGRDGRAERNFLDEESDIEGASDKLSAGMSVED